MEDLVSNVTEKADVAIGAASAGAAWITTKFEWWKNSESRLVKIGVPLGLFVLVALGLSVLS